MNHKQIVIITSKSEQSVLETCFSSLGFDAVSHERLNGSVKSDRQQRPGLVVTTRSWLDRSAPEGQRELDKYCASCKCALLVVGEAGAERLTVPVEYLPPGFDLLALHEVLRRCYKGYSRKHLRLTTNLPGVISRSDSCHICEITNLSAGGAYVKTGTPLGPNGPVTLHVPLLGMKRELELGSQVVFQVVPSEQNNFQQGAGLRFANEDEAVSETLQSFLAHLHVRRLEQTGTTMSVVQVSEEIKYKRPRGGTADRRLTIHG